MPNTQASLIAEGVNTVRSSGITTPSSLYVILGDETIGEGAEELDAAPEMEAGMTDVEISGLGAGKVTEGCAICSTGRTGVDGSKDVDAGNSTGKVTEVAKSGLIACSAVANSEPVRSLE